MDTNTLRWRKATVRILVNLITPIIDGYTSVVCRLPLYRTFSIDEIAVQAAPRFVDLILLDEEPCWPDFPDLVYAEVKCRLVKHLILKRGLRSNLK